MTSKRFAFILSEWLIYQLLYCELDAETDAAISHWHTDIYFGQSYGHERSERRIWTEVATVQGNDYDLRAVRS